ncbi:hypothetical protein OZX72_02525 [Bifidobacterium sp. ESL0769]|uniref:hypothetical protein n=1 Tax=Bifidobacterium sp. ESL0769 TaxID=2983229 RepID=UPI0023FA12E8|nr:hypothetical protein [Bifidobacterium sp. ESL0769]WEV67883.1 hypothetical protein OZX72_02525 [Bifidobacterium sp. ESL0769]
MSDKRKKSRVKAVIRRHRSGAIIIGVFAGIPLVLILLVVLLVLGLMLKLDVINPTYWPYQEKTVDSVDTSHNEDGVLMCLANESPDVTITIYDGGGHKVDSSVGGPGYEWHFSVPGEKKYTFKAKNTTGHWAHSNVHECEPYS